MTTDKRIKVAFGGRGGTKSQSIVDILIQKVHQGARVCCFREHENTLEDSVHSLICSEIARIDVPGFLLHKSYIDHESGGCFRFKGLSRNSQGIKSASNFDIFFIEEGQFISEESLRDLIPTLRAAGSELWIILNPGSREDPVSRRYIVPFYDELLRSGTYEDGYHLIVWTNFDENPWFPAELEASRQQDFALLSRAEYDHIWRGFFNDTIENSIIKAEWFDAAIDAHIKLKFKAEGVSVVSHDPSDLGPDDKAIAHRHGSVVLDVQAKATGDSNEGMDWALDYAIQKDVNLFTWDCDGMGVSLNRQVQKSLSGKRIDFAMYKGSHKPDRPLEYYMDVETRKAKKTNQDTFTNKRAQKSWLLRDRFYNTFLAVEKGVYTDPDLLISISSDIQDMEALRSEVCRIPRKHNGNGKIQIMPKEEMKRKYKIKSPNLFDALVMSFETTPPVMDMTPIEFTGWI